MADSLDPLNFFVSSNYTHDSNLFRRSGALPAVEGGSDNLMTVTTGIKLNKDYALQNFKLDYFFVQNKYDNNDYLNFNASNYKAAWNWSITPYLKGSLTADKTEALAGFEDAANTVQNIRTTENRGINLDWSPYGNWHLLGGVSKNITKNAVATQNLNLDDSSSQDQWFGGVRYVLPSGTTAEWNYRNRNGDTIRKVPDFSALLDTGYLERDSEVKVSWPVTIKSKLTANYGYLERIHDTFSQRDFAGWYGGITYNWLVSSQFTLTASYQHGIGSFQTSASNFSLNDTWSILPVWRLSNKLSLRGNFRSTMRQLTGTGPTPLALDREDENKLMSLSLEWIPRETIAFVLSAVKDERDSNFRFRDYSTDSISVSGQLTF